MPAPSNDDGRLARIRRAIARTQRERELLLWTAVGLAALIVLIPAIYLTWSI